METLPKKSAEKLILELDNAIKEDVVWGLSKVKKLFQKKQQ